MRALFLPFAAFALVFLAPLGACEDAAAALQTKEELSKLRIPALKAMLAARGQACEGCAEKDDFVTLAFETQGMPTLAPTATKAPPPPPLPTDINVEELMARFKKGGGSGRLEKIKRKLAAKGKDVTNLDLNGLAGFESLDDATLEKLLEVMAGGGPPAAPGTEPDAEDSAPARRNHRAAPARAAAAADEEDVAVVDDDDGGEL